MKSLPEIESDERTPRSNIRPSGAATPGKQLEHGVRPTVAGKPARRHRASHRQRAAPGVEEDEVEREAHAEGVDAGAARDQQAASGGIELEAREAEQAGAKAGGDRHLQAADRHRRQPREPPGG